MRTQCAPRNGPPFLQNHPLKSGEELGYRSDTVLGVTCCWRGSRALISSYHSPVLLKQDTIGGHDSDRETVDVALGEPIGEELVSRYGCGSNGRVASCRRCLCEEVGKERSAAEALGFVLYNRRTETDLKVTSVVRP